jgi:hypothetical protein
MIRKLKSGEYRLYSRKKDESTKKRRNLGTFSTLEQEKQHEREVQYFKKRRTSLSKRPIWTLNRTERQKGVGLISRPSR